MRVYLSVDLEGVNGICHSSQVQPGESGYERGVALMHEETNAVIGGALAAGATDIFANDSHWDMRNLRPSLLASPARIISGWQKPFSMVSGVAGTAANPGKFDAACFIGYHARQGSPNGVLSHTYRATVFYDVLLNGKPAGETALNAALAGWFGIPVALVTGDDVLCREVEETLPGVATICVKHAVSRYSAVFRPHAEVLDELKEKTTKALKERKQWVLLKPPSPSTIEIAFMDPSMADAAELVPGVTRTGGRQVAYTHEDYSVLFRVMLAIGALGASRKDAHF